MDLHPFKVLSLCSGGGGLEIGLGLAVGNARTVCYVENEAFAIASLEEAFEINGLDDAPIWTDVKTFDGKPWRNHVDCVTAGYPCQPFSTAGKRKGADDPRHLWPHIRRIIEEVRPGWVFLENVSGHLKLGFDVVRSELVELGFRVRAGLFKASEVGCPHGRERLFILAHAENDNGRSGGQGIEEKERGWRGRPPGVDNELANAGEISGKIQEAGETEGQGGKTFACPGGKFNAGNELADTRITGFQGRSCVRRDNEQEFQAIERNGSIPLFPPGPDESEPWDGIIRSHPVIAPAVSRKYLYELANEKAREQIDSMSLCEPQRTRVFKKAVKSAFRGMAHVLADRPHKLSLLGNGVDPIQAAVAFISLWREINYMDPRPDDKRPVTR